MTREQAQYMAEKYAETAAKQLERRPDPSLSDIAIVSIAMSLVASGMAPENPKNPEIPESMFATFGDGGFQPKSESGL